MHTLLMMTNGFMLLSYFLLTGCLWGGIPWGLIPAACLYIPVWVALALVNMYIGLSGTGYSLREEVLTLFIIVALPVCACLLIIGWLS
ncbi:hypothetical protein ACRZTK_004405 [Enterobacter asburiae]